MGTLAKGDGGGAYQQAVHQCEAHQQAVQQGRQQAEGHGSAAYQQAVQHGQYSEEPPRIKGEPPQFGQEVAQADEAAAPLSWPRSTNAGMEQRPLQGGAVAYQERECDVAQAQEEEEEEARDRVLREMEGDMFDFEADLAAEEDG